MDIRINQELTLETDIPFQSVYEFRMTWEINEHAEMKIKGISEIGKQIEQQPDISEIEHRFIDFMEKTKPVIRIPRGL